MKKQLLKVRKHLLTNSAKAAPFPPKSDAGFTLLEVLMVALMIGILSAIAAPSWQAFITRQRISTINNRVFQSLRTAQSEAKLRKTNVIVTFGPTSTPPVDPPTVTISSQPSSQKLNAEGEIKPGQIALSTNASAKTPPNSITFDYQGNVSPQQVGFMVTVSSPQGGAKQCVIVASILGSLRTDEGTSGCISVLP